MLTIYILLLQLLCSYQSSLNLLRQSMLYLDSGLCRLVGVQPVQVVHWHTQQLPIHKCSWQHSSRVCHCSVHPQFNQWSSLHPIINALMNKNTNKLFDSVVLALHLTVSLRVISNTKQSSTFKHGPQHTPEWCSKVHVMIMKQLLRNTIVLYSFCKKRFCYLGTHNWFSPTQVGIKRVSLPSLLQHSIRAFLLLC